MNKLLIESYIKNINKENIYEFGLKNNIKLTEKELDILYHFFKNNLQDLLYGNSRGIFASLESDLDHEKFLKIKDLFEFYFNKYQDLL